MSLYDISLINLDKGYGAMQKEIKDAYPKKVCHMPTRHVKKKEREKDSPYPKKKRKRNKREMIHTTEFIHQPLKIYSHTLAHLDQGL